LFFQFLIIDVVINSINKLSKPLALYPFVSDKKVEEKAFSKEAAKFI
jgi:hypothetical protein